MTQFILHYHNRQEFVNFLQNSFLPEDFVPSTEEITFSTQTKYATQAVKLGSSASLDLVVYEIKHTSKHDARVSLSKEAFRILADETEDRALVVFVPEDNNDNYRFSFIEITLGMAEGSSHVTSKYSNPHRYSYYLGKGIAYHTPNKYLNEKGRVVNDEDLHYRFSVEVLTKEFYQELSDWYAWAIQIIRFPNDINTDEDDAKFNHESAIRLITRLIFVWFLKQRHLIPEEFFDEKYIADNLLEDFDPNHQTGLFGHKSYESKYYKAILQNLFFAMLNSPITPEGSKEISERHFRKESSDYDNNKLMRYENYFKNPQLFVDLANQTVPFLNGGLFDCLDDKDYGLYYDGFSDRNIVKKSLILPDFLFFGEVAGKDIDLSEWYGDKKKKKVSARGIIDILKRYNFTVEENTPFDKEVSLDPELLGKVFENLLASFNPETQTTARKQTGSFYTPREIVQYMVDESLVAHLKRTVSEELEPQFRQLLQYTDEEVTLTAEQRKAIMQSLYKCKILDPACGSGAFPMGMLQQMVHILSRIDVNNEMWKEMMLQQAVDQTSEAYRNSTNEERAEIVADIERSFDESVNRPDYARKLYLIENCIYGVDIQPIAIQISKLRFFISLVVDQNTNNAPADNFGIRPLPNLEAKFVAANTLIGLEKKDATLFDSEAIKNKEQKLKIAKHKIFGAKTVRTKRKYKQIVNDLRLEIANMLNESGAVGNIEAQQLASWDMFDQNASSPFFDPDWMFGVKDGFDIVIANPPYIDSETMTMSNPEFRKFITSIYSTAKGNWDLYIVFIERGINMIKDKGVLSYIIPNKIIAAKYASFLRQFLNDKTSIIEIRDYSNVKVFDAFVYPCTITLKKGINLSDSVRISKMNNIANVLYSNDISIFQFVSDIYWDKYFIEKEKLDIILKICNNPILNSKYFTVNGAATVSEAYKVREVIKEKQNNSYNYKKFINTGTIDKYTSLWGKKPTQYIKGKFFFPIVSNEDIKCINNKRLIQSQSPKIIVAGMSLVFEALLDTKGEYYAGKSTSIILGPKDQLISLTAIMNSKLMDFWVRIYYSSLSMAGGYLNIGVNEIENIRVPMSAYTFDFSSLVNCIIASKKQNPMENICDIENKVNYIVYKLYRLTYEEILVVDPDTTITREEYETMGN